MTEETNISAQDHSVGVGGDVHGNVNIYHGVPPTPGGEPYVPPTPPDSDELPLPGTLPPGSRMPFPRNALFTGREADLRALAQTLSPAPTVSAPPSVLVMQVVQGMGGVGKTQLAVEFAYRYGRFFHGVHWINAQQPGLLEAEVAACGLEMGLTPWPETLPEQLALTLKVWATGGPRLVIFDNLEDPAPAGAWIARLSQTPCRVLITARRAAWPPHLKLHPLRLDCFTPEESRAFLRGHFAGQRRDPDNALDALHERLGGLPLALELAGRYLAALPRLTIPAYLKQLDAALAHPSMQHWRFADGNPTGHDLSLAATFAVSWERVQDPAARELFALAGWCAPNTPIPCELLERAAGLKAETCDAALHDLRTLGLLETENAIHPLLAEFARGMGGRERESGGTADVARLTDALTTLTYQANETGLPAAFAPLRPHVETLAPAAEAAGLKQASTLWNNLGYYLDMLADLAGARAAFERALRIDEAVYGPEHPEVARDVNNLGGVLYALGDLAGARAAFERALRIDEAVYGPDHPTVARDVNNLGGVLYALGDLAGARAACERALHIDEAVYGPEHPTVARDVNNLGSVLRALGDLAGARAACERALRIDEAVYGPDHPEVATAVNNLGRVLQDLGDLAGARAACERALRIWEVSSGPEHPNVATVVNSLGRVLHDLGDLAGAQAAFERALRIDEAVYGPEHPKVATAVNNLGLVLRDLGDLAGARAAFERALRIDEAVYGPEHPKVATAVNNLGLVLQDLGDLAGARAAFERALRIWEASLGPEHSQVATAVNNLGGVLYALGDLAGARAACERALRILEDSQLPKDHPYMVSLKNKLMMLQFKQG